MASPRALYGDDWPIVRQKIIDLAEEILRIAATDDRQAFADLLTYPTEFCLEHNNSHSLFEAWSLRSKKEAKMAFPYIFNPNLKRIMLQYLDCTPIFIGGDFSFFPFGDGDFYFSVKKSSSGPSGNAFYTVILERLRIDSSDFYNDIGKIRYGLKRKGSRRYSRPPP